jgi:sulfur carrier protein
MNCTVNNTDYQLTDGSSITDLLACRSLNPAVVVVEVNLTVVKRDEFDSFRLNEGDVVEILRFVGGG